MRAATAVGSVVVGVLMASVCGGSEVTWVPAHELLPEGFLAGPMTCGDLDADGNTDLSVIGEGASEHYWNVGSLGNPAWQTDPTVYETVGSCGFRAGALGDLDADGDLDLVTTCWEGTVRLYANVGTPAEASWERIPDAFSGIQVAGGGTEPSLVDLDGDEDLDLVVVMGPHLIENVGTPVAPSWADAGGMPSIEGAPNDQPSAAFGDIDGDGDLDLVMADWSTPPQCWENVGSAQGYEYVENPSMLIGVDVTPPCFGVELLDVDLDSDLDLVVSSWSGYDASYLYLNEQITPVAPSSWGSIKALYR